MAAASLGPVAAAGEGALGVWSLQAVDGGAAEADTVVLKTGVAEAVAWAKSEILPM